MSLHHPVLNDESNAPQPAVCLRLVSEILKRATNCRALLRKITCNLKHLVSLRLPVLKDESNAPQPAACLRLVSEILEVSVLLSSSTLTGSLSSSTLSGSLAKNDLQFSP